MINPKSEEQESIELIDLSQLKMKEEKGIKLILFLFASSATVIVFFIIYFLFLNAIPFFEEIPLDEFLFGDTWLPHDEDDPQFGASTIFLGTLLIVVGALILAIPLGLGCAIFLVEVAPSKIGNPIRSAIELLSGIPSVLYGYFGMIILSEFLKEVFEINNGLTWLNGSIILAIMILPTIVSVSADAIRAVPHEYREAALGLGATKWQTVSKVVLPAAISGITAAIILGLGRAIGETMAVIMVTGNNPQEANPWFNIFAQLRTITATIGIEMGEAPKGSTHQGALFALAVVLLLISLIINIFANIILTRLNKKLKGLKKSKDKEKENRRLNLNLSEKSKALIKKIRNIIALMFGLGILFIMFLALRGFRGSGSNMPLLYVAAWGKSDWEDFWISVIMICVVIGILLANKFLPARGQQILAYIFIVIFTIVVLIFLVWILRDIILKGLAVIDWETIYDPPKNEDESWSRYTLWPAIYGTIWLTIGAILFAVPIGVGAGIYLAEYAGDNVLIRGIRAGIDCLNGVPSIVFGLFGYVVFVQIWGDMGITDGRTMLAGQLALALMIIPTLIRTTEEAMKAIPQEFREGSLALGSSKWKSISKVVLPAALPGIITGLILSMGRVAGETAPIMFTAAFGYASDLPEDFLDGVQALTFGLYNWAKYNSGLDAERMAAAYALALLVFVIILYSAASLLRNYYMKKMKW